MIEHLGGDVNDHVGHVTAEERPDTLVSNDIPEAVNDNLIGMGETTRLDHLILALEKELDTFQGSNTRPGEGGADNC